MPDETCPLPGRRVLCDKPAVLIGRIRGVLSENLEPYAFCRDHIGSAQHYGDRIPDGEQRKCEVAIPSAS